MEKRENIERERERERLKSVNIPRRLFDEIQKNLSKQYVLVDVISEVLDIGSDSAYRRIRCDKLLNISEIYLLCEHFRISFDLLMGLRSITQFDCIYRPIDLSIPGEYYNYMLALSKNLEKLGKSHDSSILMSAMDIPVFYLITQKELTLFKLFTWGQSVYNYKGSLDDFMKEIDTPEILDCFQKIFKSYSLIPSHEIWTDNTIFTTLRLIGYYIDICGFSSKDLPFLLCEQILNILDRLQKWTESGMKDESSTPFYLYVCEMDLENTYILMKQSETANCIVKLFTINSLNIFNEQFCQETEKWLTKLKQRSVLLCDNSEKERFQFFDSQRKKVRYLMSKIQKAF